MDINPYLSQKKPVEYLDPEVRYYPEGYFSPESESSSRAVPEWFIRETWIINEALNRGLDIPAYVIEDGPERFELSRLMSSVVDVTYFVEMPREWVDPSERGDRLMKLFKSPMPSSGEPIRTGFLNNSELSDFLAVTGSSVAIALSTLDSSTAEAVRYLNQKGVRVVGWIVLDDDEGYWTNAASLEATNNKITQIFEWVKEYNLEIERFGLDLELPVSVIASVSQMQILRSVKEWLKFKKMSNSQSDFLQMAPQDRFEKMIDAMQNEGYQTEYYTLPAIARMFVNPGIKPPSGSRMIDMVYTSETPRVLVDLGFDSGGMLSNGALPAIGIVNGIDGETPGRDFGYLTKENQDGVILPSKVKHLTQSEIVRDIMSVMRGRVDFSERVTLGELYVFALNAPIVAQQVVRALDMAFAKSAS